MELMEASDKLQELFHIADKVAQKLNRRYVGVDIEDIKQELYCFAIENEDKIKLFGEGDLPSNPAHVMFNEGEKYCFGEVTKSSSSVANQEYTPDDVRRMLGDALVFQDVINTYVPEWSKSYRPQGSRRAADTAMDDWDSILVGTEVKAHMKYLKQADRELLFRKYVLDDPEFTTNAKLRVYLSRAVDRLTTKLNMYANEKSQWNDEHPNGYPGARKVMGRGATHQANKNNYGGEW